MKGLIQHILIASLFLCNYVWPMHSELPALDIATATFLEPTILESPSLDIASQHSDIDIFTNECTAHLQQNDSKFIHDKKDILEHELAQSDNEHRSTIIKEQIEIIDGLLESQHTNTQKNEPYISNKDEKIGESSLLPDSFSTSSFPLVKKMILQDQLIGRCLEQLMQGDSKVVEDKRVMLMHELSQCTHALRGERLREQIQVLDTMMQQPDIQKFSQIFHTSEHNSSTSSQPSPVHQTLDRIRQAIQQNRQTIPHNPKPANALPLSKTWGGKLYIKIDGVKTYVSEGAHISISGSDWVVIGNGVFPVGVGQARIDKNGNCHVKDLSGKLHCLANCKWIAWANDTVCLYQNQQLQIIPNTTSILIDGQQLVNINGSLCVPQLPSSTTQGCDLISTPAHDVSNISTEIDARIEKTLHKLKDQYPDFQQHMQTVHSVLQDMKDQGRLTPASEVLLTPEVIETIAHCPKHFIKQFKFSDPRENPKEFVEAVIKYGVYATFHIITDGAFLGLEKLAVIGTQVHTLLQTDFSSMNAIQKAEFITEQVAEIIKTALADLIGRKIIPKSKLSGLPSSSATFSTQKMHEAVTPEGVKATTSYAKSDESILKKSNNIATSSDIAQKFKPVGLGSTGRFVPENLNEQLALEEVLSNPARGRKIRIRKGMTDVRWPASEGWIKMAWNNENIEIHYVAQFKNDIIQAIDDCKFIDKKS